MEEGDMAVEIELIGGVVVFCTANEALILHWLAISSASHYAISHQRWHHGNESTGQSTNQFRSYVISIMNKLIFVPE